MNKNLLNNKNKNNIKFKKIFIVIITVLFPFIGIFFVFKSGYFNKTGKTAAAIWLGIMLLGLIFSPGQEKEIASDSNPVNQTAQNDQSLLNKTLEGEDEMTKIDRDNYKSIRKFIDNNKVLGKFTYFEKKEPWLHGDRYSISTDEDTYLFYLYNEKNKVVSVNVKNEKGNIKNIYREDVPDLPDNFKRSATEKLPEYIILDQVDLMAGGRYGDVLIKSFSKKTPLKKRKEIIKAIMEKESFDQAALYSSREAFKANINSSYSESHPNALKNGYLGSMENNEFTSIYN